METTCEYARQDHLNSIEDQVYKDLLAGRYIDHQSPYSGHPSSLLYAADLMSWYSLDAEFQVLINQVFSGKVTADDFKRETALLLAEYIAAEILEKQEDEI